jgi:NAD-dependent deacetylase
MRIVILTGAGISAESGLSTFRAEDGLWNGYSVDKVATLDGYIKNPQYVLDFYNDRRSDVSKSEPNAAHFAIAKLQNSNHDVFLVTQNVDDLHEKAGSPQVCHMHGSLARSRCQSCEEDFPSNAIMKTQDVCPRCGSTTVRPDIVWFGEMPKEMDTITSKLFVCDYFLAIGTSGNVYPAAQFVRTARKKKATTIEFNISRSENANDFKQRILGPASTTVSKWVDEFLMEYK